MADAADSAILPAVEYLRRRMPSKPRFVLVLGSGLGRAAEQCSPELTIAYSDIPGFPPCSVDGHAGRLILGTWNGIPLAVLQGRAHRYEGHTLEVVTRPVRTFAALGAVTLITTCAAGALHGGAPGTLFLIDDHVNLMGDNPLLTMCTIPEGSSRFVEMAGAYDAALGEAAVAAARQAGIALQRGVMACVPGPSYETPAEAEMLRRLGAHAVNMSVVPEVLAARAWRQRVLGLAVLTNQSGARIGAAGHHDVIAVAARGCKSLIAVLDGLVHQSRLDSNSAALL